MKRYIRNTEVPEIGAGGQKKLCSAKVLVCGCGGLGSSVIANLASLGIGNIGLVDCDVTEISNFNRQFIHKFSKLGEKKVLSAKSWLEKYNPDINATVYDMKLTDTNACAILENYDIIVDCFDSYKSKFMLNDIAIKTNKVLIHGGVTEFYGQVTTIVPYETPCLRCLITDADYGESIPKGVISPAVSIIGSIEAMEVMKHILGFEDNLKNTLLSVNTLTMHFKKLKISRNNMCEVCAD